MFQTNANFLDHFLKHEHKKLIKQKLMKSVFYFEKAKMKSTEMKSTLILFVHFNIIFGGFVFIGLFID